MRYPYLHQTSPSEEAVNIAKLCLMNELDWKRAALLSSNDKAYARVS